VSLSDYVIDLLLIALVLRQMQARKLDGGSARLPLALVAVACVKYLQPFTLAGNDLELIVVLGLAGLALGTLSGLATRVWRTPSGEVFCQAGALAAVAWIAGMGFRFAFAVYSTHGGRGAVARFSQQHQISSAQAYVTALVVMAAAEVLARVVVLQLRRFQPSPLTA
jgi:hypothetical protein